jgi:subtilisin-like proprotein convertase family protein
VSALALFASSGMAQTASDNCVDAPNIGVGNFAFDNTAATTDGPAASCGFNGDPGAADVWFRFVAPATASFTLDVCQGTNIDSILTILDACGGVELACNDDSCGLQSRVTFNATAGTAYLVRIAGFEGDIGTGTLTVTQNGGGGGGGNDDCANAQAIAGPGTYAFDQATATTDGTSTCGFNTQNDVWFAYTAAATGQARIETCGQAAFDTVLNAFDTCGGTQLACNDDACALQSRITLAVTAGTTYIVRVAGYNGARGAGNIVVTEIPTGTGPAGDDCTAPIVIATGPGTYPFDTTSANTDPVALACAGNGSGSVWYRYTPTQTGAVTVSTCGQAGFDTVLAATSDCAGTQLACNDDFCGLQSTINFPVVAGTAYLIRVSGFGAATGTGNIVITETGPLTNDLCENATALGGPGTYPFTNLGAGTDGVPVPCGFGGDTGGADVFYTYTAASTNQAIIDTCGSFDTNIVVLDACGGNIIACNDDACGLSSRVGFPVTQGTTYIIQVGGFAGATGAGNLTIVEQAPILGDTCDGALPITLDPGSNTGSAEFNTVGTTTDGPAATCGGGGQNDVFYSFVATRDGVVQINTCGASFDTIVSILDGSCAGASIGCNDDAGAAAPCAGTLQSFVTAPVVNGQTYIVRVAGFGTAAGTGTLSIAIVDPPAPCITPTPGAFLEDEEPCGTDLNGGCNTPGGVPAFTDIPCGSTTIFGTAFANGTLRDTDWYLVDLPAPATIEASLQAEFPAQLLLLSNTCPPTVLIAATAPNRCVDTATISQEVPAGTYIVFASNSGFADYPCGATNNYLMTVNVSNCAPLGACCSSQGCSIKTEAQCSAQGGSWQGAGTECTRPAVAFNPETGLPAGVPDNSPAGTSVTLTVPPGSGTVDSNNFAITLGLAHTWVGDLVVQVSHGGQTVVLFTRLGQVGGAGFGFATDLSGNYRFYDGAANSFYTAGQAGGVIPAGDYQPSNADGTGLPTPSLAIFNGMPYEGDWTIELRDLAGGDVGTLSRFTIGSLNEIDNCPPAPACARDYNGVEGLNGDDLADYIVDFFDSIANRGTAFPGGALPIPGGFAGSSTAAFTGFGRACPGAADVPQPNPWGAPVDAYRTNGFKVGVGQNNEACSIPNGDDLADYIVIFFNGCP